MIFFHDDENEITTITTTTIIKFKNVKNLKFQLTNKKSNKFDRLILQKLLNIIKFV